MRILIVEDEVKLATALKAALQAEAYAVDLCDDGLEAETIILEESYDAVVMDIGLPGKDGVSLCKSLRSKNNTTPILLLTAKDTSKDKVAGLDAGADDYLIKPFDLDELLARLRSLTRRQVGAATDMLMAADVELDRSKRTVHRDGQRIDLTAKEYALLEYLIIHKGAVVSKEELLSHVWDMNADPFSKVVDVYIGYLRNKIDKPFPKKPPFIQTIKGMGYKVGE